MTVWLGTVLWPKLQRRRHNTWHRLGRWTFALIGLLIALAVYGTAFWFLRLCYQVEVVGPLLVRRLLDVVLLALLSILLLSNIVTSLSSFFLASDLDLLVSAPVPPRTLFGARFAEQIVQSSWMVLAFGLPVLLAFAKVAGTPLTYPILFVAIPPLLIVPGGLAAIITMLLVRSFPAARVRDLALTMAFIAFLILYVMLRLLQPERFINPDGFASMVTFLASFSAPSEAWVPSHWATEVIASTFRDDAGTGQPCLMLAALWTGAGSAFVISSFTFRRVFAEAYSRSQQGRKVARISRLWARLVGARPAADGAIRAPRRIGADADWLRVLGALAPRGPAREFLIKDLKLLVRDASQWSQLVLLVALMFVYLYNFRHFRQIGEAGLVDQLTVFLIGLGLSAFVTTAVSVRFAFPLISMEGRMLWLLYSAPMPRGHILRSKLLSTLPPLLLVAVVMAAASAHILGVSATLTWLSVGVALLTAVSVASIAVGIGALVPDYRAESAAKVAASFGGLVCMSVAMAVALMLVAWAAYPAWVLYHERGYRLGVLVGCGCGALLTAALAVWLPLHLGTRALTRRDLV